MKIESELPDPEESETGKEGTAAHFVAQELFKAMLPPKFKKNMKAPNGYVIDQDMYDAGKAYVDTVKSRSGELYVETKSDWEVVSGLVIRCRADAFKWDEAAATLYIDDYKYGWRPVEVEGNWQLIGYAVGICRKLQIMPARFVFTIHQPRAFHPTGRVRTWNISVEEFVGYYNTLVARFQNTPDELRTGDWCNYCKAAAGHCAAMRMAGYNAVDVVTRFTRMELSPEELSAELDIMERAATLTKKRAEWLAEYAKAQIKSGKIVPGRRLDPAKGQAVWNSDKEVVALQKTTGIKLRETVSVSPAEAVRRGVDQLEVNKYTTRPDRGLKLVKGPSTELAERVFNNESK